MPGPYTRLAQFVELAAAPAECASHVTGWLRMLPFRSLMSTHFTSPLSPRNRGTLVCALGQHDLVASMECLGRFL